MSVDPISHSRADAGFARVKAIGGPSDPAGVNALPPAAAPDRSIVSEQARQLSAALAGRRDLPKLHLSPQELRALVSPREPATGVGPSTAR